MYKKTNEAMMNINHNFQPFFSGMYQEMLRHWPEQGDNWLDDKAHNGRDMDEWLKVLLDRSFKNWKISEDNKDQLIDIANFCAMLWSREPPHNAWLIHTST